MNTKLLAFAAAACIACSSIAETITFDGLSNVYAPVTNGYSNLQWDNFYVLDAAESFPNALNGYLNGTVSGNHVAYNAWANPAVISSNQLFTLKSGYFTAAWNNGLTINVEGFGANYYQTSFVVDSLAPTNVAFNWTGLSSVKFSSSGGIHNDDFSPYYGEHFALDDLVIEHNSVSTPEPSALMLMALALFGLGFVRRRKD